MKLPSLSLRALWEFVSNCTEPEHTPVIMRLLWNGGVVCAALCLVAMLCVSALTTLTIFQDLETISSQQPTASRVSFRADTLESIAQSFETPRSATNSGFTVPADPSQ